MLRVVMLRVVMLRVVMLRVVESCGLTASPLDVTIRGPRVLEEHHFGEWIYDGYSQGCHRLHLEPLPNDPVSRATRSA
jgi:hypothetical protein